MKSRKMILKVAVLAIIAFYGQQSMAQRATVSVTDYDEATSAYEEAYFSGTLNAGKTRGDDRIAFDVNLSANDDQASTAPTATAVTTTA